MLPTSSNDVTQRQELSTLGFNIIALPKAKLEIHQKEKNRQCQLKKPIELKTGGEELNNEQS
jgi:hypothetical protein